MAERPDAGAVPLFCIVDEVLKLKQEWEQADEAQRRFMEQRYGKKVIRRVIEESFSQAWLDEFSKKCPQCNTNIQVILFSSPPHPTSSDKWRVEVIRPGWMSSARNAPSAAPIYR